MRTLFILAACILFLASCEDILEVPDISGQEVELVAPLNGTVVNQNLVNFTWNGVADADAYLIQVATPNFAEASQVLLDSIVVLDSTFLGTQASKSLLNSTYEWRVKAVNSAFETDFSQGAFSVQATGE